MICGKNKKDLRNYNKEQSRGIKKLLNTQHWGSYSNAPLNALWFLGRCAAFSVFLTHLKAQSFPLLPTGCCIT